MFFILVLNVLCIFLMMVPGYAAVKRGYFSESTSAALSMLLVNFIYPCLIFHSILHGFTLKALVSSWTLPAACLGVMSLGCLIGSAAARFVKFRSEDEKTSFIYLSLMNNYSFLPLPLVMAVFGDEGVAALIFSSLGAELAVWTLGVFVLHGRTFSWRNLRHLASPPLLSLYLAVALLAVFQLVGTDPREVLESKQSFVPFYIFGTVKSVGLATIPIAMIIAGARMAMIDLSGLNDPHAWLVSALRLIVIPLACIAILKLIPLPHMTVSIITVVAVMPAALASILMSEIYGGDKHFMALSVFMTHVLSIATIPTMLAIFLK